MAGVRNGGGGAATNPIGREIVDSLRLRPPPPPPKRGGWFLCAIRFASARAGLDARKQLRSRRNCAQAV